MNEYGDYSAKEQLQLEVCQRLISEKSYLSRRKFAVTFSITALTVSASLPFPAC